MAGVEKEEFPPLLAVGFHDFNVDGLKRLCLGRFPQSITRRSIMAGVEEVLSLLQRNGMRGEVWINGSFTTEKLNPDDADLILVVEGDQYAAFSEEEKSFFDAFGKASLRAQHRCDNYAMIRDNTHPMNEWVLAYWLRQFGFSRNNQMKGLAVIRLPFVVIP